MKHGSKVGIIISLICLLGLGALALPGVDAFANTFLEDKTMELYKGEIGEYCIYLQNTGEQDLVQAIRILEGREYIENLDEVDNEFNVIAGTISDDLPVCMKVKLPGDSKKGEKYIISYAVAGPSSDNEEGIVSINPIQITEKFYLTEKLDEKENPIPNTPLILAAAVVVLVSVIAASMYFRGD